MFRCLLVFGSLFSLTLVTGQGCKSGGTSKTGSAPDSLRIKDSLALEANKPENLIKRSWKALDIAEANKKDEKKYQAMLEGLVYTFGEGTYSATYGKKAPATGKYQFYGTDRLIMIGDDKGKEQRDTFSYAITPDKLEFWKSDPKFPEKKRSLIVLVPKT